MASARVASLLLLGLLTSVASWGVRKQDAVLLRAIDDCLLTLRMSPAKSTLVVKYFSEDALVLLRRARKESP